MNIKTEYDPKPIPIRQYDWCAWDDDIENSYIGYGLTEQEAIKDFMQSVEEEIEKEWYNSEIENKKQNNMQTVSLNDFYNKVMEVAKQINEDYIEVKTSLNTTTGLSFDAYINGQGWHKGRSTDEVLQKIIAKLNGESYPPSPQTDVLIEEPQENILSNS